MNHACHQSAVPVWLVPSPITLSSYIFWKDTYYPLRECFSAYTSYNALCFTTKKPNQLVQKGKTHLNHSPFNK
jgi:hypothetical protein